MAKRPLPLPSLAPKLGVINLDIVAERPIITARVKTANRLALVRYAIGKIPAEDMYMKMQLQNYKCMYCKWPITFSTCHIDHVHPIKRGGEHYLYNTALTCATCNVTKSCNTLEKFCKRMRFDYHAIKQELADINHQLHVAVFGEDWKLDDLEAA